MNKFLEHLNNENEVVEINGVRLNLFLIDQVLKHKKITHRKRNLYYTFLNTLK